LSQAVAASSIGADPAPTNIRSELISGGSTEKFIESIPSARDTTQTVVIPKSAYYIPFDCIQGENIPDHVCTCLGSRPEAVTAAATPD
jgi:hypothetical protein